MIFKCKMCGGELVFERGATVAECEYCGTTQTLPKLDDDKRANMYDRANHFRRQNEYDKAMAIYEQILAEDRTDAEAYWSLVLCKYGIEYVEDPATHKRVPTVNRVQYASILADEDYKSALEYADAAQKAVYEAEANAIAEIQKGILDISKKEAPFDVFICYKETGADGRRTPDSVLANELYHQLTNEGFKVFFSRITLEDKIGTAYEPYIFAALNSAKVMVVLGTKPEYFNAVWVKNEWSRYLSLIRGGADKALVPAYRDMDPYDLPEEFSHLQALDMGKLGFMPDLVRGIKKLIGAEAPKPAAAATPTPAPANSVAPLLKRAFMFLEDGNWGSADEYAEKVLDIDPENGRAYLAKLMAQLKVRSEGDLKNQPRPFDGNAHFQKALRFGDDALKAKLAGDIKFINDRNEHDRQADIFRKAVEALNEADTVPRVETARALFNDIPTFEGVREQLKACDEKIEAINEAKYQKAEQLCAQGKLREAAATFDTLGSYRDSAQRVADCHEAILATDYKRALDSREARRWDEAIRLFGGLGDYRDSKSMLAACEAAKQADAVAAEQQRVEEAQARAAEEKRTAAKKKKILALVAAVVVLAIAAVLVVVRGILPRQRLNKAIALREAGQYEESLEMIDTLWGYMNEETVSDERRKTLYAQGTALLAQAEATGDADTYLDAENKFLSADTYQDASEQALAALTGWTDIQIQNGNYEQAIESLKDRQKVYHVDLTGLIDKVLDVAYGEGIDLREQGEWSAAIEAFERGSALEIAAQDDSNGQSTSTVDEAEEADAAEEALEEAAEEAVAASGYDYTGLTERAEREIRATWYAKGVADREADDFSSALKAFEQAGNYGDADEQINATYYAQAEFLVAMDAYEVAAEVFDSISGYSDAATRANECRYQFAMELLEAGDYDTAAQMFSSLGDYEDAATQAKESQYQKGMALLEAEDYEAALAVFDAISDYSDMGTQLRNDLYQEAQTLNAAGQQREAYKLYALLDDYKEASAAKLQILADLRAEVEQYANRISAGGEITVGLKSDGTAVATGPNDAVRNTVASWTDIVAIDEGYAGALGLKSDGTVVAASSGMVGCDFWSQSSVNQWQDVVSIAATNGDIFGVKSDGTVHWSGHNYNGESKASTWTDIKEVYADTANTIGLKNDGTIVYTQTGEFVIGDLGEWQDIVDVVPANGYTVGLKSDGTVVAARFQGFGGDSGECAVDRWTDIVAVASGGGHTVGLKSDGTVVAVGGNHGGRCDVTDWTDIVAVAAGGWHTVGLKSDGTVVAVGYNGYGQCDVGNWTDIVAVAAGEDHTVGLKSDGTVVAVGSNDYGQCDVGDWDLWD